MTHTGRVRMKDIAQALGISVVTVSRALKDHPDVSASTRERVREMAEQLRYTPNLVAQSLAMRKTFTVGLVVPDLMHSFFAEVCKGVERYIAEHGYQALIVNSDEDGEQEQRRVESLLARQVDGLILASAQKTGDLNLFEALQNQKIPFVLIDRLYPGVEANYVGCDDEQIGLMATEHLVRRGCKRIAHLKGPDVPTALGRFNGYRNALEQHGLKIQDDYVLNASGGDESGYEAMKRLLQLETPPDAIFAYNDPVAVGAIKAILESGRRVPEDIAVVGSGNVHYSDMLRVPLTTVDQGSSSIGERAGELLLKLILGSGPAVPETTFIPPKLVVRESA